MNNSFWIFLVLLAGALLPIQAGLNARIGKEIQSPVWASVISFGVGLVLLLLFVLLSGEKLNTAALKNIPPQNWLAGGMGAFYITVSILAFPRLGAALTFSLVVTSQVLMSLIFDHNKIFVEEQHPASWLRMLGLAMIIGGVLLIRKF